MGYFQILEISFFTLTIIFAIGYVTLISRILRGWESVKNWQIPYGFHAKTKVSIIVAARNEEKHIKFCIESILACKYPSDLMEVIVINDHSSDSTLTTLEKIKHRNLRVINLAENVGKKEALSIGISKAEGQLIIGTDADCNVPRTWLEEIVSYYENSKTRVIASPIRYISDKSLIQRFQYLDNMNNMAVTGSGIHENKYFMANGANIAYEKSLFEEIGGFSKNKNLASGDDMFLIQAAAKLDKSNVRFLKSKNVIVDTLPMTTWKSLIQQRKRWATKSKTYASKEIIKIQGYVFVFVCLIFLNLLLSPFGTGLSLFGFGFAIFIKWSIDYLYLSKLTDFFVNRKPLKFFLKSSALYMVYILLAGWWAIFPSKYVWKGRKVK